MGYIIGFENTSEWFPSTWGSLRTPIIDNTPGIGPSGANNLVINAGWVAIDGNLFRAARWLYNAYSWTDQGGVTQVATFGPFAVVGNDGVNSYFKISGYNADPAISLYSHLLDDDEIQGVWVGRNVVLDTGAVAMEYDALDTDGGFQVIDDVAATDIVSFDL